MKKLLGFVTLDNARPLPKSNKGSENLKIYNYFYKFHMVIYFFNQDNMAPSSAPGTVERVFGFTIFNLWE